MNLLGTVSKALGNTRKIQMMASLDHSMWFYEPFDMSQPLLFFMQTQVSSHGRGLAMGRFYSQKGRLLAIVVRLSPHALPLFQPHSPLSPLSTGTGGCGACARRQPGQRPHQGLENVIM